MPNTPVVQLKNVLAQRGETFRLHINSLICHPGDVLCVAGPNGSGKSTLIECLSGLFTPHYGSITIQGNRIGQNVRTTKLAMGYIPDDENWFIKELCAQEYFVLLESIYKEAGAAHNLGAEWRKLAARLHFSRFDVPLQQLSHGNKKKVQIIAALMHQPPVLIMDELRNGLDPLAIIQAEQLVTERVKEGCCVIAATHDLWWAERIATEVMLLIDGKPVLHDSLARVRAEYGHLEKAFLTLAGARV